MRILRSLGPAVPRAGLREALRAGLGVLAALAGLSLVPLLAPQELRQVSWLLPPFGATALLLFAVPSSPLAQPWSALVGNMLAALIGVAATHLPLDPGLRVALAVGLAVVAMILARAVHPPAGAVAMMTALAPEPVRQLGVWVVLMPVGLGTLALVALAAGYARLTGRHYPARQFEAPNPHRTADAAPPERLGLTEDELTGILTRTRQALNLGVEDLARLVGAAELQAATHRTGPMTAAEIMSRDLITVQPETPLAEVAALFRRHRFTSLPVVGAEGRFLGVIFQIHLILRAQADAARLDRGFAAAARRLMDPKRAPGVLAADLMAVAIPRVSPQTPIAALLPMMADGRVDAVPVLQGQAITGIVTRTDLIAALARQTLREG